MTTPTKKQALEASGMLNPHPEAVRAELFQLDFFDPCDRAQVKYEMLRAHSLDGDPISEVCQQFGFSREGFYQIQEAFSQLGFSSFLPRKPGRKGPTKLKGEVLEFALAQQQEHPELEPTRLAALIKERYSLELHRTTVMRGMKKKRPQNRRPEFVTQNDPVQAVYESVREESWQHLAPASWARERVRYYGVAGLFPDSAAAFPFLVYAQSVARPAWSGKRDFHRERLQQAYELLINMEPALGQRAPENEPCAFRLARDRELLPLLRHPRRSKQPTCTLRLPIFSAKNSPCILGTSRPSSHRPITWSAR